MNWIRFHFYIGSSSSDFGNVIQTILHKQKSNGVPIYENFHVHTQIMSNVLHVILLTFKMSVQILVTE